MSRAKTLPKSRVSARRKSARQPSPKSFLSDKKTALLLSAVLAVVTIVVYIPAMNHSFIVLDDREYVTANPHIHTLGWETVKWAFTATAAANWHPLTWLSHAVDYKLFALNPLGHHLDSVLIHAANAALLFLLLYWLTDRLGPSLFVAALFALHPINVESVAWVSERKNVLSTFFLFLAVAAYAWYAKKPDWRRYLAITALFAASLMAKPMAVTFPFLLLLLDYWPLERIASGEKRKASGEWRLLWLVLEKLPLLALSAASSWITLKAQRTVVQSFAEYSPANRIQNAIVSYGLYLWKMIWPSQLTFYAHPTGNLPIWQWSLSAAVLIAITAFVILFRRKRYLPVGWFWFLGTLVPVLGLVQVGGYAMADRYAYLSLIGIFIMIAWGLADLAQVRHVQPVWCVVPALCVLAALAGATVHQIGYWDSDYHLNSHMLEVAESSFAHNAVAMSLLNPAAALTKDELATFASEPDRVEEARKHFERALELTQAQQREGSLWDRAGTLNNLANLDRMQNRLDAAREHDEAALAIYRDLAQRNPDVYLPYLASTLNNLGTVDRLENRSAQAHQHYEESLKICRQLVAQNPTKYLPNLAMTLNEYAMLDAGDYQIEIAREHYDEALAIDRQLAQQSPGVYLPQLAMTLENIGVFDAVNHRLDDSRQSYEEALKIDRQLVEENPTVYRPDLAMTLTNLGRVDYYEGRIDQARARCYEALSILESLSQGTENYATEIGQLKTTLAQLEKVAPPRAQ